MAPVTSMGSFREENERSERQDRKSQGRAWTRTAFQTGPFAVGGFSLWGDRAEKRLAGQKPSRGKKGKLFFASASACHPDAIGWPKRPAGSDEVFPLCPSA